LIDIPFSQFIKPAFELTQKPIISFEMEFSDPNGGRDDGAMIHVLGRFEEIKIMLICCLVY